ncbi:hypothetical protein BJY04DRAFT_121377 [Aspergillus karnatakaensis]|uniref:uncharacterized protein n=1 Tax=Aspergillus karnatakaensis TaxID=1810916 RepID=UPI003CCD2D83
MKFSLLGAALLSAAQGVAALDASLLETFVDSLELTSSFNPIEEAYWTGYPHHRRTPFAVSPDGESAYIAYLDSSETDVHVQQVDPSTFAAVGTTVTVTGGKEAGGLVAHNDGFALLTNEALPSGTSNAPADNTPVPVLYRYTDGTETWKTYLGGPSVEGTGDLLASPDLNGDLVYSADSGLYGAYFVVTSYSGSAAGHFGDSIQYVNDAGELQVISGASSSWGCSHNTGIALEAAAEAPFASICAEDQGAIWLNTEGQGMSTVGVKISNENTTNGASGEPMGGMSGSYSQLVRFGDSAKYIFAWPSRGAVDVTTNDWMGAGYTHVLPRNENRNVAVALFSDKYTKVGDQATSEVGAADGDSQITWITEGNNDHTNVHAAAFGSDSALLTWEEISEPVCDEFIAMGCRGTFTGTYFQQVDSAGAAVGASINATDVYVAGDIVNIGNKLCWPYVSMEWDLSQAINSWGGSSGESATKISFACVGLDGSAGSGSGSGSGSASQTATATGTATATATGTASQTASETASQPAQTSTSTATETPVEVPSETPTSTEDTEIEAPTVIPTQIPSQTTTEAVPEPTSEPAAQPPAVDPTSLTASTTSATLVPGTTTTGGVPTTTKRPGKGKGKCRAHGHRK